MKRYILTCFLIGRESELMIPLQETYEGQHKVWDEELLDLESAEILEFNGHFIRASEIVYISIIEVLSEASDEQK